MLIFHKWLTSVVGLADGIVSISRTVADDLADWLIESDKTRRLNLGYFHLGTDIDEGRPTNGLTGAEADLVTRLDGRKTLLMVGTVEPRKGHAQVLDAMDILWASEQDLALVIIGKQGWMVEGLAQRLRKHPEHSKRLFWFERASDGLLDQLYKRACALVMASEGEGFGLPLIEAAQHLLPIIARDIPVFREVAGDHAFYFHDTGGEGLAAALAEWLAAYQQGNAPDVSGMPRLNWAESTQQLLNAVLEGKWYRSINLTASAGQDDRKTDSEIRRVRADLPLATSG
jgi:glycosyltransferase involved in cell wall biosynthesis